MRPRPCSAKVRRERRPCSSASSPATRRTRPGVPSSDRPGGCWMPRWKTAGIPRDSVYVTNAVKHFKFVRHELTRRRLHKKPSAAEVRACRPWLMEEIRLVQPELIVALGSTAAQALLGKSFRVTAESREGGGIGVGAGPRDGTPVGGTAGAARRAGRGADGNSFGTSRGWENTCQPEREPRRSAQAGRCMPLLFRSCLLRLLLRRLSQRPRPAERDASPELYVARRCVGEVNLRGRRRQRSREVTRA